MDKLEYNIEYNINDTFFYENDKLIVIEIQNSYECDNCYFLVQKNNNKICKDENMRCTSRRDKKQVIFKLDLKYLRKLKLEKLNGNLKI